MKNINYITLNCFQSDYCIFVYIYSYSASQQHRHLLVRWCAFKKRPLLNCLKLIELPSILNDHALCALLVGQQITNSEIIMKDKNHCEATHSHN